MGHDYKSVRGFSLVELVAVIAVVASAGAVLGPSFGGVRSKARGLTSEGNLMMIGQASAMYGIDSDDRIPSFTWRAGDTYVDLGSGNTRTLFSDAEGASRQVQNILYRATGRLNGFGRILNPSSRLMYRRYTHLVLADYIGGNVSDAMWADPADEKLLGWQANPLGFFDRDNDFPYGNGMPNQQGYDMSFSWTDISILQLWPFSSSYQVVPHAWQNDFGTQYVPISETPHLFRLNTVPGSQLELGERRASEVVFPSAKVYMFEEFDREHSVGDLYFSYHTAAPAKLMFDGSINTQISSEAQISVNPDDYNRGYRGEWRQPYVPLDQFPIPFHGLGSTIEQNMRYRWTLGGLSGVNYPTRIMSNGR